MNHYLRIVREAFYAWLLKKCLRHYIDQGNSHHKEDFATLYREIVTAHRQTFYEDNKVTTRSYLENCLHKAIEVCD